MLHYIKPFFIVLFLQFCCEVSAQKTTVWIVRHAEKDTSFVNQLNPDLTGVGMQRAKDLAAYLQKQNIVKIFSTDTKRTKQTATYFNVPLEIYNPKSLSGLREILYEQANGKSALIIGHSNTVLETIEALGGARPVTQLSDDDYDYLFKVELEVGKSAMVSFYHFGQFHRGGTATMQ
jgi:phosphohistidine phosphatase SixA